MDHWGWQKKYVALCAELRIDFFFFQVDKTLEQCVGYWKMEQSAYFLTGEKCTVISDVAELKLNEQGFILRGWQILPRHSAGHQIKLPFLYLSIQFFKSLFVTVI